jgi:hypothetical protein
MMAFRLAPDPHILPDASEAAFSRSDDFNINRMEWIMPSACSGENISRPLDRPRQPKLAFKFYI